MGMPEYRGARAANAGAEFHKLYAIRKALSLLDQTSGLVSLTVEGLKSQDEAGAEASTWDGVDCALYLGTTESIQRVAIEQLKYSSASPDKSWTVSRLTSSTGKNVNNSVVRRLADAFAGAEQRFGSSIGITARLLTNQPVSAAVLAALGASKTASAVRDRKKIQNASGLDKAQFQRFVSSLDLTQTGSRFALEKEVLQSIASWTDDDSTAILNTLLRFITQKMLPESKGEVITGEEVLLQFGFSSRRALFPCPSEIKFVKNPVIRSAAQEVASVFRNGQQRICLHGHGGCGKTTAVQEMSDLLPAGSAIVVFDCYGAGKYLDSDGYRHRAKDAFLQLCNDIAATLRVPIMLDRGRDTDYTRAFRTRLETAAKIVACGGPTSLLVVVVDAADNSVTAASSVVPPERSFVHDFVTIGTIPSNVRFLVTARTGRLESLRLPPTFRRIEISGFELPETRSYVLSALGGVSDAWITDFHQLSNGNPRVQSYALEFGDGKPSQALDYLRPRGKQLADIFQTGLTEALRKNGGIDIRNFAAALIALPRPMPWQDLAHISQLSVQQVRDVCSDLAPGIRISGERVGFADEDFEHFVQVAAGEEVDDAEAAVASWFHERHKHDPYAAAHVAAALQKAGRGREVIELVENETTPAAIKDPILRHEVQLERMRVAMQIANEQRDTVDALRTVLAGAEALKTDAAVREMLVDNPDLAAAFARDSAARIVLLDPSLVEKHGPFLFHLMSEDARSGNLTVAREDARQLQAWLQRREDEYSRAKTDGRDHFAQRWQIETADIAAEIEAHLSMGGVQDALRRLSSWSPKYVAAQVARTLVPRLIKSSRTPLVRQCLTEHFVGSPWDILLLVPLARAGEEIDLALLESAITTIDRRNLLGLKALLNDYAGNSFESYWIDLVMASCEIVVSRGGRRECVVPVLRRLCTEELRGVNQLSAFKSPIVDVVLRASSLLALITGETVQLPSQPKDAPSDQKHPATSYDRERRDEVTSTVGPMLPLYTARARILCGGVSGSEALSELDNAVKSFENQDYRFSYIHGSSDVRTKASLALLDLCMVRGIENDVLLSKSLGLFGRWFGAFNPDVVRVLSRATFSRSLHSTIISKASGFADEIRAARTTAGEKVTALLSLVRLVEPISREDARALFIAAHQITEEIDIDSMHRLKAISALAHSANTGATGVSAQEGRLSAATLWSVVTDSAIRLSGQEGFPWKEVTSALVELDFPLACAAICRWEDSGVVARDTTLPVLIEVALRRKLLSAAHTAPLLSLLNTASAEVLSALSKSVYDSNADTRIAITEEIARDELLRFGHGDRPEVTQSLTACVDREPPGPWLQELTDTNLHLSEWDRIGTQATVAKNGPKSDDKASERERLPVPESSYKSEVAICNAVRACRRLGDKYVGARDILATVEKQVPVSDRVLYLNALANVRCDELIGYETMQALNSAVKKWYAAPAVQQWCNEILPEVIVQRLPDLAAWLSYRQSVLPELLGKINRSTSFVVNVLISAIAKHSNDLDASTVYEMVGLTAEKMVASDAKSVFDTYCRRLCERIPPKDLETIDINEVPESVPDALARVVYALMSDCDVRIRWRAAHCVRSFAKLNQGDVLGALLRLYDRLEENEFRAADAPFYWMAARLWLMIALDRVALENPAMLRPHAQQLTAIASDPSFPHVLVRAFAADAVLKVANAGCISLTARERKSLSNVNSSKLPRIGAENVHRKARDERERRFHFDQMDTIPYWYEPVARCFANLTVSDFVESAEHWIVDRWRIPTDIWKWADEPRQHRFGGRKELLMSHRQGSLPVIERYSTHVEWHAMWCTVGELLLTVPLRKDQHVYSDLQERIDREKLTSTPFWLSDFRCAKPLEERFWLGPTGETISWVNSASEEDFLRELGIGGSDLNMLVVEGYQNTRYEGFRLEVRIRSALVNPDAALALVRALQTVQEPYDYCIPAEDHDLEIDEKPYQLVGWLAQLDPSDGRIDEQDPFRNTVREDRERPGRIAGEGLTRAVGGDGVVRWSSDEGNVAFVREAWSDVSNVDDDPSRYGVRSEGDRLRVSVDRLSQVLNSSKMDLVVEVEMTRRNGERKYGRDEDKNEEAIYDRVYLLRRNGSIETAEGRVGTWQVPRGGARASRQ